MKSYVKWLLILQALVVQADGSLCGYRGDKLTRVLRQQGRSRRTTGNIKITGGSWGFIRDHPWQAAIVTTDREHQCGGTIISQQHVLSAAHCFRIENKKRKITEAVLPHERLVMVGSVTPKDNGLPHEIDQIFVHEDYVLTEAGAKNDIAVLQIIGQFTWTNVVFPICLPDSSEQYITERSCIISGYGTDAHDDAFGLLKYGDVELESNERCKEMYGADNITEGMFCAAGYTHDGTVIDTCKGDSGGPLYCPSSGLAAKYVLLGVTSFGGKCGRGRPGVYTKVANYLPWIQKQLTSKLIWHDEFNTLNTDNWEHYVTAWNGVYGSFQYYRNDRKNSDSFVKDGKLHIRPTFVADELGEDFLRTGNLSQPGCTVDPCYSRGNGDEIASPVFSAYLANQKNRFSFKFGRVEVRAKMPRGDWLVSSVSLFPINQGLYGPWPRRGDMEMILSRGNKNYTNELSRQQGVNYVIARLSYGSSLDDLKNEIAEYGLLEDGSDYSDDFHVYSMDWNENSIIFACDGKEVKKIEPPVGGFWQLGGFRGDNIWAYGSKMAPFDQEFYIIIDLAAGGQYFHPYWLNAGKPRPWNDSGKPKREFWEARKDWEPTWDRPEFIIDNIRIYR